MPRLTIIVPLMDQVDAFETTLASVLRYAGSQVEVLAAIAGEYQDQYGILAEIGSVPVDSRMASTPLGRSALAANSANSPWIYWLSPGIEMTESGLMGALNSIQQRDLGLASPRIIEHGGEDAGASPVRENPGTRCLASSVAITSRFHPVYLEELIGEEWSVSDLSAGLGVVGPTGWAGLVQRQLLEQWAATDDASLPKGYAELSLGIYVERIGWAHRWTSGELLANQFVAADIETGYRLTGRSSNRILEASTAASRKSPFWSAVRAGLSEATRGFLAPQLWRVAWERFSGLPSLRRSPVLLVSRSEKDSFSDEIANVEQPNESHKVSHRDSGNHAKRLRSAA
jgi:hypothetical protein